VRATAPPAPRTRPRAHRRRPGEEPFGDRQVGRELDAVSARDGRHGQRSDEAPERAEGEPAVHAQPLRERAGIATERLSRSPQTATTLSTSVPWPARHWRLSARARPSRPATARHRPGRHAASTATDQGLRDRIDDMPGKWSGRIVELRGLG
jgi:hypothetical protein